MAWNRQQLQQPWRMALALGPQNAPRPPPGRNDARSCSPGSTLSPYRPGGGELQGREPPWRCFCWVPTAVKKGAYKAPHISMLKMQNRSLQHLGPQPLIERSLCALRTIFSWSFLAEKDISTATAGPRRRPAGPSRSRERTPSPQSLRRGPPHAGTAGRELSRRGDRKGTKCKISAFQLAV